MVRHLRSFVLFSLAAVFAVATPAFAGDPVTSAALELAAVVAFGLGVF